MEEEIKIDMTPQLIKDLGMRYPTEKSTKKARYGLYECQYCNKEFEAVTSNIKIKNIISCGCRRAQILTNINKKTHGLTYHKYYQTWRDMINRCNNPKNEDYKNYGGRGIIVCEEWLDIKKFIAWAEATHPDIEGVSLDRIDNDLGYSPENCRWADRSTQNINKRISKRNTSGFVGVNWSKSKSIWVVNIKHHKVLKHVGRFKTKEEAVLARDQYIIKNKLPHKLSTQY